MQHVSSLEDLMADRLACVTVGGFDGVHLGHQALIRAMQAQAQAAGQNAVVLTFFPHPSAVLRGPRPSFYLSSPDEKAEYLAGLGVDALVTHPFSRDVATISAADFVHSLVRHANLASLWCGPDFALGHNREGTVEFLRHVGADTGFSVRVFEPATVGGRVVSSTLVRNALAEGHVEQATGFLGRPYSLAGEVVAGAQRGRQLGIPTANIRVWEEKMVPAVGVYACLAHHAGGQSQAVVNIGFRPTFDGADPKPVIEAHLLDYSGDLYGTELRLHFVVRLRAEMKFSGIDVLLAQIQADIADARRILAHTTAASD